MDEGFDAFVRELNADLGVYSFALGSAHKLPEGGYHFNAGWVPSTVPASARSVEVDASGQTIYSVETARAPMYRSFRLKDLYTAPSY